jgi:hypothetical protein
MSLSTQLTRGALALPLLAMFALLGATAGQAVEAEVEQVAKVELIHQLCAVRGSQGNVLVLAQAPGDLGRLAIRWNPTCRG